MSLATSKLQHATARLSVYPPPKTLSESTAVLKKLMTFGRVTSFQSPQISHSPQGGSPESDSRSATIDVVFASRQARDDALKVGKFTVTINENLPDAWTADPYNIRGLQSRQQPLPKTMMCRMINQPIPLPDGQNIFSRGFSPSVKTRLAQSFKDYQPPVGLADGLGVFHNDSENVSSTADFVEPVPDLMGMYRARFAEKVMSSDGETSSTDKLTLPEKIT
jgi:hypothetical protein